MLLRGRIPAFDIKFAPGPPKPAGCRLEAKLKSVSSLLSMKP